MHSSNLAFIQDWNKLHLYADPAQGLFKAGYRMESVILEQSLVSVALNSEIARVCAKEALSLFIAYSLLIIVKDMLQNVDTGLGNGSRGSLNPKEQPACRLGWKRTWIREKSKSGRTSPEKGKVEKKNPLTRPDRTNAAIPCKSAADCSEPAFPTSSSDTTQCCEKRAADD